jgi:hypothetical protein
MLLENRSSLLSELADDMFASIRIEGTSSYKLVDSRCLIMLGITPVSTMASIIC